MEKNAPSVRQIIDEVKEYLSLQYEWIKLDSVEKLTRIASALLILIISLILVASTLFYLSFAAVYALEPYFGLSLSFAMAAGIFIILLVLLWLLRVPLVVNPILRFFYKIFLHKEQNSESPNSNEP